MQIVSSALLRNTPCPIFFNFESEENKILFTFDSRNAASPISSTEDGISRQLKLRHLENANL